MAVKRKIFGVPSLFDSAASPVPLCPGCQHGVIIAMIANVIEEMGLSQRVIVVNGAGCNAVPFGGFRIDGVLGGHGRPPDVAAGIKRVLPDHIVFTLQGDGDLLAIGADPLLGVLARGEKITIVMLNNTLYASTGGQLAPTTMLGQVTPTTPYGRQAEQGYPVHAAELLAQFKSVVYSARGAVNTPANYQRSKKYVKTAFQKQMDNVGLSFVEIISACPTQWHLASLPSLKRIEEEIIPEFPLGEFKNVDSIN